MKKTYKLTVRVTEEEYETIKLKAELSDMSMSRFMAEKAKSSRVEGYAEAKRERDEKKKKVEQLKGQISL